MAFASLDAVMPNVDRGLAREESVIVLRAGGSLHSPSTRRDPELLRGRKLSFLAAYGKERCEAPRWRMSQLQGDWPFKRKLDGRRQEPVGKGSDATKDRPVPLRCNRREPESAVVADVRR